MATRNTLPSIVSPLAPDVRNWAERVRESLEQLQANQEEITNNYYTGSGGGGSGGGGGGGGGGGTLPCGNPVRPPAPTGLTVDGGFGFFMLTWDMPSYCGHSYTEVWGLRNDDLGAAVLLGSSIGQTFTYAVNEQNAYWCFWIRHVNILGEQGPYNQTGGVCAQTALDPGYLLDLLKGQITESQLYRDLGTRIDLIEPTRTQVETEKRIRETEDGILAQRVDTVWAVAGDKNKIFVQATAPTATAVGDLWYDTSNPANVLIKRWNGTSWVVQRVDVKTYYQESAPTGNLLVGDLWIDTNDQNQTYRWAGTQWVSIRDGLASQAWAGVTDITTARIGYCGKRAKGATGAWTTTEYGDKETCLATHPDSGAYDYQWFVGLPWASAVKQVSVTVPDKCYLNGQLQSGYTKTTCEAATGTDGKPGVWITGSTGALEQAFNASSDELGKLSLQYTVKIDNNGYVTGFGLASTPVNGVPFSEFGVRADRFYIAAPQSPPNFISETQPTAAWVGQAWYQPSSGKTRYWTGSAWTESRPSETIPFVVQTTPVVINGETVPPGVYMDSAYIVNGTITTAKIGDATITSAKIKDLTADKIRSGSIAVDTYIQSSNYVPTSTGWKLWTDATGAGYAEFNGGAAGAAVTVRGSIYADRGYFKGCLLGGAATEFDLGTGFFAGWADANGACVNPGTTGAVYKWRVGTEANQRMTWDGSYLRIWDGSNKELVRYGTSESWLRVLDAVDPNIERVRIGTLPNGAKGIEIRDASNNVILNSGGLLGGGSANLLNNSDFSQAVSGSLSGISTPCEPWAVILRDPASMACTLTRVTSPTTALTATLTNAVTNGFTEVAHVGTDLRKAVAVVPGGRYEGSAYVGVNNAYAQLWVRWLNASNAVLGETMIAAIPALPYTGNYPTWGYAGGFVTAPATATQALVFVRIYAQAALCVARMTRVYFGSATANQTSLTPWSAATYGPIGPGTIGTYLSTAVIDTAYIKDAAITNAKIGTAQVDTLKIGENAVTIPNVLTGTSGSFVMNAPVAMPVIIIMSLDPSGNSSATMRVTVSGATNTSLELSTTMISLYTPGIGDNGGYNYNYWIGATKCFKAYVNQGSNTFTLSGVSSSVNTTVAVIGAAR